MANPNSLIKNIHPEDLEHVQHIYHDLLEGALIADTEFRIVLRNKAVRRLCVKPLLLEDEQVIIGYAEDITSSKEYVETLKKYSDKKNAILNILSHDLAGPLAMIQSLAKMLSEDLQDQANEEIQQVIQLIQRNSQRGTQLIQEFMKQEFLESANADLIKHRVDLVQKVRVFMEEYQQQEDLIGKTIAFLPASECIYLELDDVKFMQVINNLISNALKFTPDGGKITISLEEKEATVLIMVADNGKGIPAKYHATLFEKFSPARRPGIKGEPSVGLGMSIIKTIVDWHHGHIWLESKENVGTTFYIELPKT